MSGKTKIREEMIIHAALGLVREQGWASVSARVLAERLDCSTMPIYSAIGSMDLLRAKVCQAALDEMGQYQEKSWSENRLLDMAVGYVAFARDQPRLFRFIFEKGTEPGTGAGIGMDAVGSQARANGTLGMLASLHGMAAEEGQALSFHSWVYIHGLANLVADGILSPPDAELTVWLEFAGAAFWQATSGRKS